MENGGRSWSRVGNECQSFSRGVKSFRPSFSFVQKYSSFVLLDYPPPLLLLTNFPTKQLFPPLKISQVSQDVCFVLLSTDSPKRTSSFLFNPRNNYYVFNRSKKKKNVTKIYKIHLYILDHPETSDCFAALSSPPPSPRVKNPCRTTTFQSWTRYRGCRYCCAEDEAYFFGRRGWSRKKGVHGLNSSQRLSNDG